MSRYSEIAGSGRLRVTTDADVRAARLARQAPVAGTNQSLWPAIESFWDEAQGTSVSMSPATAERVWVANRCIQLNAQQIASMPLQFDGTFEPAWVSHPDPAWYPNGISDALFAIVRSLYGHGYAILYVTSRYANGFVSGWTVADPDVVSIRLENGRRAYKISNDDVASQDVVQIDRNPGMALHGTSAIRAYATSAWGVLASGELSRTVMQGGVPHAVLKTERRLDRPEAEAVQAQWMSAVARTGRPPVLPPDIDFKTLSFSPKDLMLLEAQGFSARVVASAFGVPPFLINLPLEGGLTYQNPEKLGEFWWRFELRPTAKRIADALTAQLLPRGNFVVFDAADTFLPLTEASEEDDPQGSQAAKASPSDQNGSVRPLRPMEVRL